MKKVLSVILKTIAAVVIVAESFLVVYFIYETSNIKEREKDGVPVSQGTFEAIVSYNVVNHKNLLYERMGRQLNGTYSEQELRMMYESPYGIPNYLREKIARAENVPFNAHDIGVFLDGDR